MDIYDKAAQVFKNKSKTIKGGYDVKIRDRLKVTTHYSSKASILTLRLIRRK